MLIILAIVIWILSDWIWASGKDWEVSERNAESRHQELMRQRDYEISLLEEENARLERLQYSDSDVTRYETSDRYPRTRTVHREARDVDGRVLIEEITEEL